MNLVPVVLAMFSVVIPTKLWFAPSQPVSIQVKSEAALTLVLTTFDGKPVAAKASADVPASPGGTTVDLRTLYPQISDPGTFVLFAVPRGSAPADFVGTPIVIEVLASPDPNAPRSAMVARIEPLRYAIMTTDQGPMTMIFYNDVAPNTVDSFLRLASEGYYDGLTFHRIMPTFMLQGGDPVGDGSGGPGYNVNAEFNERPHEVGALSMARQGDPNERPGGPMPGPAAANSAGSQFFICLDYSATKQLDGRYTVFGKVVDGTDTMKKLAATPLQANGETPIKPPVIQKVEVFSVAPGKNPYADIIKLDRTAK